MKTIRENQEINDIFIITHPYTPLSIGVLRTRGEVWYLFPDFPFVK
jgi:hypothetical protein